MAQYRDGLPSQKGWIHELAQAEIHPDAERIFQLGKSFDPHQVIEESTVDFLSEMRSHMTEFARTLNAYSETGARFAEIKIYSVAQTAADFLIFRNQVKLVVANVAHGVIQFSFTQHMHTTLAVDGQGQQSAPPQELLAQVGPFRNVYWSFQGEKVTAEQVAKFYFVEFIRASRDPKRLKNSSQVLLEQIKTFLEEKGFEVK